MYNYKKTLFYFLFTLLVVMQCLAKPPADFEEAKKQARAIWNDHRETFYCGCHYDKHAVVNFKSCSFQTDNPRKDKYISWEHVVAASWYGKKLACWNEPLCTPQNGKPYKGRKCCRKIDPQFNQMEADLHNLVPAIRSVNEARENYTFGEFYLPNRQKFYYNQCPIIIDDHYRVVEPRDEVKGMVARINFYMADKYAIELSEQQRRLLTDWNNRFPPSAWEKQWDEKVAAITGEHNPYIASRGPQP